MSADFEGWLDELETLQSIFSEPGDLTPSLTRSEMMQLFTSSTPNFKLRLHLTLNDETSVPLMLTFSLPPDYPSNMLPHFFLDSRRRLQDAVCLDELRNSLPVGEFCLFSTVQWLQENGYRFLIAQVLATPAPSLSASAAYLLNPPPPEATATFAREFLYFIGFYTKSIRRAFVALASELRLTGFLMPGKPGFACLEGDETQLERFIFLTRTELFATVPPASRKMTRTCPSRTPAVPVSALASLRKFRDFRELVLVADNDGHARADMADLSQLAALMREVGLGAVFAEVFDGCAPPR